MLSIFASILCAIENLALSILAVFVLAFNAIILAIGVLIAGLLAILPSMPAQPPDLTGGLGWLNYFVPVGAFVTLWGTMLAIWVAIIAIRIGLRWVRAL